MHSFKTLETAHLASGRILKIILNRPQVMNAINSEMMQELHALWKSLASPPTALRCIILTGAGEKAFCAGADLKERYLLDIETWQQQHAVLQMAMRAMTTCAVPIIAAINGVAYGGGLELLLASDFAYAASTATFAQSETKWGIMPGAMGTQNLPNACGLRRAKELAYTAASFSAEQAYAWGIVNKICTPQSLMSEVLQTAERITQNAPLAVRAVKKMIDISRYSDLQSGYAHEVRAYNEVLKTKDREKGMAAFHRKSAAEFEGQ